MLSAVEKKEFNELEKKLTHYKDRVLVPFELTLVDIDLPSKELALDDFFQKQSDFKPTNEELEQLKLLAHKDPELAQAISYALNTIEEYEAQILNRLIRL